jgi:hypothetical protein
MVIGGDVRGLAGRIQSGFSWHVARTIECGFASKGSIMAFVEWDKAIFRYSYKDFVLRTPAVFSLNTSAFPMLQ